MNFNDRQEAALLAPMEDENDDEDGYSVDSDENQDESAKEMAWDLHE